MKTKGTGTRMNHRDTQLSSIRDLMAGAATRGAWLTLHEIAKRTDFAEPSISAQLRHLRKEANGGYRVEKRPRFYIRPDRVAGYRLCHKAIWEYRVIPPQGALHFGSECTQVPISGEKTEPGSESCQNA